MKNLPELAPESAEEIARVKRSTLVRVVDDDDGMRRSYDFMLKSHGWRVACYADAQAFLAEDTDERGCLILDVRMPGMTGLELQKRMLACGIDLPVIFVTGHGDVDMAVYTMQIGACDFMLKPVDPQRLRRAVLRWCAYDQQRGLDALRKRAKKTDIETLSEREREVLRELIHGIPYKCIAETLGISERTVKFHKASICKKLGVRTSAELAMMFSDGLG